MYLAFFCSSQVSARNSAPLSPAVSKTSAAAVETLYARGQLLAAARMQQFAAACGEAGWRVLGAAAPPPPGVPPPTARGPPVVPCSALVHDRPTLLVMGNEATGLRSTVRAACSELTYVASGAGGGGGGAHAVDSLNVSVACGAERA